MSERRIPKLSLRGPVILFVVVLVLMVTLTVLWNVVLVNDYQRLKSLTAQDSTFHWTFVLVGSALFLTIIALSSVLGAQLFSHIRWRQRQSDFLASVSHELNSPLSSIKLFAQTLRSTDLSEQDRRSFVEKILFDVERLARLIGNILRAAEIEGHGEALLVVPQPSDLGEMLHTFARDAGVLHAEAGLQIEVDAPHRLPAFVDRLMFRQVLDNLVDNAVRYSGPDDPVVAISAREADEAVTIEIEDRGIGIPSADLPRIFERFYRVQGQPARRRGTGIGLFVVRSIVEAHGGRVSIRSRGPGLGTSVRIVLPHAEVGDRAA